MIIVSKASSFAVVAAKLKLQEAFQRSLTIQTSGALPTAYPCWSETLELPGIFEDMPGRATLEVC